MPDTPRGYPVPSGTDRPDVVRDLTALAEAIDTDVSSLLGGPGRILYTRTFPFADLVAGASRSAVVDISAANFTAPPIVVVTFASNGFVLPAHGGPSTTSLTVRGWNIGGSTASGISCHIYCVGPAVTP